MAAVLLPRRTVRIGLTGLARSGKTALLTSIAANLRAVAAGYDALPALSARLGGRSLRVAPAPAGAAGIPRFEAEEHLKALADDPPHWPMRTDAVSLLALDIDVSRARFGIGLPPLRLRLEILDYPGEWLLDLPLLSHRFRDWSERVLRRLEAPKLAPTARDFLGFVHALPAGAAADEVLAATGHRLYRDLLLRLRDAFGLSLLQPGRFLMPPPGPEPPWMQFFPHPGSGGFAALLAGRYNAYVQAVRRDLAAPGFRDIDRVIVLADLLAALHAGQAAFDDTAAALGETAAALSWRRDWQQTLMALARLRYPPRTIRRVAYVASKADHVAERQRGNLGALMRNLTAPPPQARAVAPLAIAVAAVRATEDFVWTLEGHPVSAVRGRVAGEAHMTRSYPGEVPDRKPDAGFWVHPFLKVPQFEPMRPAAGGNAGLPQIGLGTLLAFLLDDLL